MVKARDPVFLVVINFRHMEKQINKDNIIFR